MTNQSSRDYGDVWTAPAGALAGILARSETPSATLRAALACGYFSTYAAMTRSALAERLVDWQLRLLAHRLGANLEHLPAACEEAPSFPASATVLRHGRRLSADLLRNVWYVDYVMAAIDAAGARAAPRLLEVGSGNGSFAFVLKALHPGARACLVDIPESLRIAELYLREALPQARVAWLEPGEGFPSELADCDFLLVPIDQAPRLHGQRFDLAANIWSFGEMPNHFIARWFDLIQRHCEVQHLFTLNAFLSPVTRETQARARQGDWLLQLDAGWHIERFDVDPAIHRCPFIKDFHKGAAYVARRIAGTACPQEAAHAAALAREAEVADWVELALQGAGVSVTRLRSRTDYTAHFSLDGGADGPVFAFWNDLRMNADARSGSLLVACLAMVARSEPGTQCTKEELFLLRRLPSAGLHQEYRRLLRETAGDGIEYEGEAFDIQSACDRALVHMKAEDPARAEDLFLRVAAAAPAHGDCWYYLALLAERRGDSTAAAAMARHAWMLAPDYAHYRELLERLLAAQPSWFGRLVRSGAAADGTARLARAADAFAASAPAGKARVGLFLAGGDGHECFCSLAEEAGARGEAALAEAFETAAVAQLALAARAAG